jgi:8-oxo-dGTP diphosphatase
MITNFDQALAILNRDRVRNANIINFMCDYPVLRISIAGESVMIKGRSDRDWIYISCANDEEFLALAAELTSDDTCFAIIEDWMLPRLTEGRHELWRLSCLKLYLPDNVNDNDSVNNSADGATGTLTVLTPDDAAYIYANYDYAAYTTEAFIAECINKGPSFGIREDGKLVAWIMTQDDGAMGFLTVLPSYRRRGYGDLITSALIRQLRASGKIPFVHIEEQNHKSMNLARKAGFIPDRRVHWFELA